MPSFYSDALRFLEFGFNGATLLLAILAFRLLSAEQRRASDARPDNLQGLRLYRNFALLTSTLMLISGPLNTVVAARYSPVRAAEYSQCRDALDRLDLDAPSASDPAQTFLIARQARAECTSLISTVSLFFR